MILEVEIFPPGGAQARYLVRLSNDVYWTDDIEDVVTCLREDLRGEEKQRLKKAEEDEGVCENKCESYGSAGLEREYYRWGREAQARVDGKIPLFPSTDPDPWKHRTKGMRCRTCMWFVEKVVQTDSDGRAAAECTVGRCRRHAPTMSGYPVVYGTDWCGDHKLDEEKA